MVDSKTPAEALCGGYLKGENLHVFFEKQDVSISKLNLLAVANPYLKGA